MIVLAIIVGALVGAGVGMLSPLVIPWTSVLPDSWDFAAMGWFAMELGFVVGGVVGALLYRRKRRAVVVILVGLVAVFVGVLLGKGR
jgi:hypothetical protein